MKISTQVSAAVGYRGPALLAKALAYAVRGQVRDLEAGALVEDLGDAFRWRRHLAHRLLAVRVRVRLDPAAAAPKGQDFGVDAVVATLTARRRRGGDARRRAAVAFVVLAPVWKSKFYGAFVLNHRVVLNAIDATPARWRGDAGSSALDRARSAASSPRNDLVKNCRAHPTHWLIPHRLVLLDVVLLVTVPISRPI